MDFFTLGESIPNITNPIGLFSHQHLFVLIILFLVGAYITKTYKLTEKKNALKKTVANLILLLEIARQITILITGQYTWDYLPLHLCGLGVFIIFVDSRLENSYTKELLFMLTFPGALAALITPDWAGNPLWNFFSLQSFIIHAFQITYVLMRYYAQEINPRLRKIWMPIVFLSVVLPFIALVNSSLKTNFFFMTTGAPGSPLEALQNQFGNLYLPAAAAMVLIIWIAMYTILGARRLLAKNVAFLRKG